MRKFLSTLLAAGTLIAATSQASAIDESLAESPRVLVSVSFGAPVLPRQERVAMQFQSGSRTLAEFAVRGSGAADLRLGGIPVWSRYVLSETDDPATEVVEETSWHPDWTTIGLGALGVVALAVAAGGGGGDSVPQDDGSKDGPSACVADGANVGDVQGPDTCVRP